MYQKKSVEVNKHNYIEKLSELYKELAARMDDYGIEAKNVKEDTTENPGSGWIIHRYKTLAVDIFDINSVRGSSYIPTPEKYSNPKCGLINIKNEDNECFRWCMKYHQSKMKHNDLRTTSLKKVNDKYDYSGLEYPVSLEGIKHFEDINKVCVCVYEVDDESGDINECRRGNMQYVANVIYLLLVEQDEKAHYIYIRDIGRLLNLHHYMINKDVRYCPCCKCPVKLNCFCKHVSNCAKLSLNTLGESTIVTLPDPSLGHKTVMKFENYKNKLKRPYIVYADTECTLNPSDDPKKIMTHVPNSACFYFVCNY